MSTDDTIKEETLNYETSELNEAAFLWTHEDVVDLQKLEDSKHRQGIIDFKFLVQMDKAAFAKLMWDYANSKARVDPHKFVAKQNRLRDLLKYHMKNRQRKGA